MDAFHAFLAAAAPSKARPPARAKPAPSPREALFRRWHAERQAANHAANPDAAEEFAALIARLNRMAERLHTPLPTDAESADEEEYQTPLPPPGWACPPPPPPEFTIPAGARLIYDENRPPDPPARLPKVTLPQPNEEVQGRGKGGGVRGKG